MNGLLAELYSAIDSKKRQLKGLLSDPVETIQQGLLNFRDDQNATLNLLDNAYQLTPGSRTVLNTPEQIKGFQKQIADKGADMAFAGSAFKYPKEDALAIAQRNGQKMLGLPAHNTQAERMKAIASVNNLDDAVNRAHQFGLINYQAMPVSDFKGKLIHKSPSYNRAQSSEYRLGEVAGEPAYMRKSNHWGDFTTNVKVGDNIMTQLSDMSLDVQDIYGRAGKQLNNWKLSGGIVDKNAAAIAELEKTFKNLNRGSPEWFDALDKVSYKLYKLQNPKKSEAGYVPISSLVGKVPSKTALINEAGPQFEVPFVTLPNGNVRSRFAAFDPARINESDFLAGALPFGLLSDEETRKKLGF